MGSLNKLMLIGNVGKDPEVRLSKNGDAMATFTLATSYGYKTDAGDRDQTTEWHRIVMWRKLAEQAEKFVKKGRKLYIEGRVQTRSYEQNGEKRYVTEVVADRMEFLDSRNGGDEDDAPVAARPQAAAAKGAKPGSDFELDDNPFSDLDDLRSNKRF
jgi:single-strand DNA-binding protein